jgi:hypothetical protein
MKPSTWLQTEADTEHVRDALRYVAELPDQRQFLTRAAGDPEFALWLRLADQHLAAEIRETRQPAELGGQRFPWRGAYLAGWSPRAAAEAAHHNATVRELAVLRDAQHQAHASTADPSRAADRGVGTSEVPEPAPPRMGSP